ncbi:MAG: homocysteine S-methyltransferase family protein [Lachnospiraceae bacterium]|nr:homocysteine S-methyltransferase family protein [Lachnospiraceae bacterium]
MKKEEFRKYLENRIRFLDGATGTNLMRAGMPAGVCPEAWILEHEDVLLELQRAYAAAGSDIVYAPTFTGNRIKLREYGLESRLAEINTALVALSKKAVEGHDTLVAGDITMTGRQVRPVGDMEFDELVDVYREQIAVLRDAGVDLLVVETMMSLQETRAAMIAAGEVAPYLPVMATLTFEADGRTLFGTDAASGAVVLEALGASAVGANCSTGPSEMADVIRNMAKVTTIPIIAKPNAGFPRTDGNGNTYYDMTPEEFAEGAARLVDAGASVLGACCGSTPAFIEELHRRFSSYDVRSSETERRAAGIRVLASERRTLTFKPGDPFMIVGERINPTGKKKLQAELREGKLDLVADYATEQEACGASILDINVGMPGIDEHAMMKSVIYEVMSLTDLPLCLDSTDLETMEDALRTYPGRALINSVSLEKGKAERFMPLAKKYGAMVILLPVGENGIPETVEEKISNVEKLLDTAYEYGLTREDIVVDALVATVGADPNAAVSVLKTVSWCSERDISTICGLSNVSFGLPQRGFVNAAFLTMAIDRGLTMAISNPSQELLVNSALAADLLKNKEGSDGRYLEHMSRYGSDPAPGLTSSAGMSVRGSVEKTAEKTDVTPADTVKTDVLKGNRRSIAKDTKAAIDSGIGAEELLNSSLMPAINEVGELFNSGKYFLPQLIASAEAMKLSITVIEPLLAEGRGENKYPKVVFATVKGDVHDIGKNLVVLMLRNVGFEVIDLGKDVPTEEIVQVAIDNDARLIGLSALMTTTMQEMKAVVELARVKCPDVKIMIGGAVVTADFARDIGADAYTKDAAEAVLVAKKLLGIDE